MYRPHPYARYYHNPWTSIYTGPVRYSRTWDYYNHVRVSYPSYIYLNWIWWPTTGYSNGYYVFNNYPYFVFNGYRYRYSNQDYCNYQLVDKYTHTVVRNYWEQQCNFGYDQCAYERDRMNENVYDDRYSCAETYRDSNYDFGRPTYDYRYEDYNNGGYNPAPAPEYPDYGNGDDDYDRNDCYDYDYENDICYDV